MPVEKLKTFLENEGVKYVTIKHSRAFTAQEIAASAHVPGKELAKTVMVKLDDELAMAVLPAPDFVSLEALKIQTGAGKVALATEAEFHDVFPTCEIGAMPPFGNLWGLKVFVDERLSEDDEIVFNAGSHTELVRLAYADYERLVDPKVLHLSTRPVGAL